MKATRLSLLIEVEGGDPMQLELAGDVDIRTLTMSAGVKSKVNTREMRWEHEHTGEIDLILHVKGMRSAKPAALLERSAKCLHCGGWTCRRCA